MTSKERFWTKYFSQDWRDWHPANVILACWLLLLVALYGGESVWKSIGTILLAGAFLFTRDWRKTPSLSRSD